MAAKDITFSAANTAGLNNPGTEIITLVKDGSGNFINPPSYDKMRAYLRSGDVPMLLVTDEGGETGSLYQLVEYSEAENKIRFSNDTNTIEFCAGCEVPNVYETGKSGGGGVTTLHINVTAVNLETMEATFTADKTPLEMQVASVTGPIWCVVTFAAGVVSAEAMTVGIPPAWYQFDLVTFGTGTLPAHNKNGNNDITSAVLGIPSSNEWRIDLRRFSGS